MDSIENNDLLEDISQIKGNYKEIESKLVARILRLLNGQDKPRKRSEIIGLIHEFHKQYLSLYAQYDHLRGEMGKRGGSRKANKSSSSMPSSDSSEYYSSDEIENANKTHNYEGSDSESENSELLSSSAEHETQLSKHQKAKRNKGHELKLEVSGQIKELEEQLTTLQTDLESSRKLKNDLQVQIEEKEAQVHQLQDSNVQLQSRVLELENKLEKKGLEVGELTLEMAKKEKNLTSEIEMLTEQVKERNQESIQVQGLRDEMESMKEELARKASYEQELQNEKQNLLVQVEELKSEMSSLCDRKNELEETITSKTREANELKEEKDKLQKEFDSFVSEKNKLVKQDSADNLIEMENEIPNQTTKNGEQHKLVKTQSLDIRRLMKMEAPRYRSGDSPKVINHQALERKVSEAAEKFQMKMENQIRLLAQRIRVAEQIQTETKDNHKKIVEKLKLENKELDEKNAIYEAEAKKLKVAVSESERNLLSGLDLMVGKLDEENEKFYNRISRITNELEIARKWITLKNDETRKLKEELQRFSTQQEEEEDKEENVECLFTSQLERKVEDLESQVEEREEIISCLKEEKMEAIRQLCVLIDYHRHRYDHLGEAVSKMPNAFRKPA